MSVCSGPIHSILSRTANDTKVSIGQFRRLVLLCGFPVHTLFRADSKDQWHALVDKQAIVDQGLSMGNEGPRPAFKQSRTCSKRTTFKTATTQRAKTTTHSGFISHKRGGTDVSDFLEYTPTTEPEEIKKTYHKLARKYHPDKFAMKLRKAGSEAQRLRNLAQKIENQAIRKSYEDRAKKKVEDAINAHDDAVEKFKNISNKYAELKDPENCSTYDQSYGTHPHRRNPVYSKNTQGTHRRYPVYSKNTEKTENIAMMYVVTYGFLILCVCVSELYDYTFAPKTLPNHFYVKVSNKRTNKDGTFSFPYVRLSDRPVRFYVMNGDIRFWNFKYWHWAPSYTTTTVPTNTGAADYLEVNNGRIIGILRIRLTQKTVFNAATLEYETVTIENVIAYTPIYTPPQCMSARTKSVKLLSATRGASHTRLHQLLVRLKQLKHRTPTSVRATVPKATYLAGVFLILRYSALVPRTLWKLVTSLFKPDPFIAQAHKILEKSPESIVDPIEETCKSYPPEELRKQALQGFTHVAPPLGKLYRSGALKTTTDVYTWLFRTHHHSTNITTRRASGKDARTGGGFWPWTRRKSLSTKVQHTPSYTMDVVANYVLRQNGCLRRNVTEIGVAMHASHIDQGKVK